MLNIFKTYHILNKNFKLLRVTIIFITLDLISIIVSNILFYKTSLIINYKFKILRIKIEWIILTSTILKI